MYFSIPRQRTCRDSILPRLHASAVTCLGYGSRVYWVIMLLGLALKQLKLLFSVAGEVRLRATRGLAPQQPAKPGFGAAVSLLDLRRSCCTKPSMNPIKILNPKP